MQELYRLLSIKHSTTSPFYAIGNGLCELYENMNMTIKNLLQKGCYRKTSRLVMIYYASDVYSERI